MISRLKASWHALTQSLGFLPGLLVALFAAVGIVVVEVDGVVDLTGVSYVFSGDGSAARTVLSVIAGSLITVAGLTFSSTLVVLQLASSQFSPRILRTFFSDRITQITIGTYVGTFVYALLVLRAVGSFDDAGFVPRIGVTLASLLGIGAVLLLIVYLHHVSKLVQVSHITAAITHDTLKRTAALYPETFGRPAGEEGDALADAWREDDAPGEIFPSRPGYVHRVDLESLPGGARGAERIAIRVCPGDFAGVDTVLAEVWPADAAEACGEPIRAAIAIASERDLDQDVEFGVRQLADTALRAISPGINDPMTAVTCISYIRSILVRLTERADPPTVRRFDDASLTVAVRHRHYEEHLEALLQLSRYVDGDAWVATELLGVLAGCLAAAERCGAHDRLEAIRTTARVIGERALDEVASPRDRAWVEDCLRAVLEPGRVG